MKKIFLVPFVFLSFINIFAWEYIKKYSYAEYYRAAESPEECGVSVYEVCIKTISENKETIRATIFHTLTLFSQYISQEVELKLKNDKYEFSFTDTYNNKGYGWIKFIDDEVELFLDCNDFDELGKNFARLYDDERTFKLYDTSNDSDFVKKAVDEDLKIKKLLNRYEKEYFPLEKKDTLLSVLYIGKINGFEIYKTNLLWNIHSSRRITHRLVFFKDSQIVEMYTGIQSDKILIKNDTIIFKDINSKNNVIEINSSIPSTIYIDGELFCFQK